MNTGSLLTLGAVAAGGYFLYENFFAGGSTATAASLPSDAGYVGPLPLGSTVAVPSSMATLNPGGYTVGPATTTSNVLRS